MKKIISVAAAALVATCTAFAQEKPAIQAVKDTVIVTVHDTIVVDASVTRRSSNRDHVHLDFDIPFYRKAKSSNSSSAVVGSFGVGTLLSDSKVPFDFSPQNSLEFFGYLLDSKTRGHSTLSYGPGATFRNLALTGDTAMSLVDDGTVLTGSFPAGSAPVISKLRIFSLSFPMLYSYNFGRGFGFTLGPVVNLNASSSIVNKYRLDGDKMKDKYKNAHCNLVTADVMFQLNLKYFSIYAKYSPMNVMDRKYWPEFQTWSIGIAPF